MRVKQLPSGDIAYFDGAVWTIPASENVDRIGVISGAQLDVLGAVDLVPASQNPFADESGLHFELVDNIGGTDKLGPVHVTKTVRVNGIEISKWMDPRGFVINPSPTEATRVTVEFLAAEVRTVNDPES